MMNFFVIVPLLFTIFISLMVGIAWVSFFRNLVMRSPRDRRTMKRTTPSRTNRYPETTHAKSRRKEGVYPSVSRHAAPQPGDRQLLEELLRLAPQDVYRLLKRHLPERYQSEIAKRLQANDWEKQLRHFLKGSDIWPILRKALVFERPVAKNSQVMSEMHTQTLEEGLEEQAELAKQLELEYNELAAAYERLWEEGFEGMEITQAQRTATSLQAKESASLKKSLPARNQEWLRQAVIANEILKRPEY